MKKKMESPPDSNESEGAKLLWNAVRIILEDIRRESPPQSSIGKKAAAALRLLKNIPR